ncbi:metal ABC transporter solute-binding protein, Zn/Mn family [Pectinatus sottacetonis]|uniref:metal ABC transporter solute-binding protein, Zn/Mn family n=1 Tax=Pectinatus sottacetonis TaxID=1002795 RepID=UPI0018C4931F|nr:zinc ABC transporter substrate-binding protein [Pectinatus sottacetonis]
MKKKILIFALSALFLFVVSGCSLNHSKPESAATPDSNKLKVAVSFQAMKGLTEAIGKDHITVESVIPDGSEPHNFQPTVKNLMALHNAKLFIYNGFGLENAWLNKVTNAASDNKDLVLVEASKGGKPLLLNTPEYKGKNVDDPHFWVSINGSELEAKNIKDALVKADPKNKADYEKNYQTFYNELESLKKEYSKKFADSKRKDFVTGHAAFGYLAKDFGLEQKSISDALLSGEPSAKKLKELTDYCKKNQVTTIFVEDMVSPKVSETLAKEVNAKAVKIYTLESSPDKLSYIDALRYDLEQIYKSLN